jgi:hypothetical protein
MESHAAMYVELSLRLNNTIGKNMDGRTRRVAEDLKLSDEISYDRGGKMYCASDYFIMALEGVISKYVACKYIRVKDEKLTVFVTVSEGRMGGSASSRDHSLGNVRYHRPAR